MHENFKFSCKGIQKAGNHINYKRFEDVFFNGIKDKVVNKGFRYMQQNKKRSIIYISKAYCTE